jgi:hypothetical protein
MTAAPRGLVYIPPSLLGSVEWQKQTKLRWWGMQKWVL